MTDNREMRAPMRWTSALLWLQSAMTGLTGIVLFAAPAAIPTSFGLTLTSDANLLCYFYGATELALCLASLALVRTVDLGVRRAALGYFAAVHAAEAAAAGLAVSQGVPRAVLANGGAHMVIALLFILALSAARAQRAAVVLPRRV